MQVTNKEQVLDSFELTIKMGAEKMKFTIMTRQSKDEMFDKLKLLQPQCALKKNQTLRKLRSDLHAKLNNHNVKPTLVNTIKFYLAQNFSQQQDQTTPDHSTQTTNNNHCAETTPNRITETTPNRITETAANLKSSQKGSLATTQNVSAKGSPAKPKGNYQAQKKTVGQQQGKKVLEQQQGKKTLGYQQSKNTMGKQQKKLANRYGSIQTKQKSLSKIQRQPKKQQVNQDLIKAYQTIMQKSTQAEIKMMAKKCLEELGKLPQAERSKQAVPTKLFKQPSPPKPAQELRTYQKQKQSKRVQSNQKSPIELINPLSQNRWPGRQINYDKGLERSKDKFSNSPSSRDYRANRYNYSLNNHQLSLQRANGYNFELSKLSASFLKSNGQRKFNYLHNFS